MAHCRAKLEGDRHGRERPCRLARGGATALARVRRALREDDGPQRLDAASRPREFHRFRWVYDFSLLGFECVPVAAVVGVIATTAAMARSD